ncbi:hypothetical protein [Flavisolibacter ginsenosidimutans]|uniref:Uncharacterized protein n=1 Tax=Flavisolibacter ginsenosidimutans TaxID=661481 RepID=A0A5B8UKL8_9BACT|nr:hypothetical protein [Flavisolibacter ginsenosidimutans]QEC56952.1 hypothetical protein FSB75_13935 [Flavisolibacter ginsenosidimutans]
MTDRSYTSTNEIEKARALWEKGVLVAQRTGDFYKMQLYQLHDIYLEVVWHTHFNVVVKVTRFSDTEKLEPYLNDISIEELFA